MKTMLAITCFVAGSLANCGSARADAPAAIANASAPEVGVAAPAFMAKDLATGKLVGNKDFAGKVLVVNFWATWCPPCRKETPDLIRAYETLHGKDVAFLGIDTTEVGAVVKTFLSAKGVPYPVALAGPDVYNAFGISYIPTTVVIDPQGVVRARWTGGLAPERLADFVSDAKASKTYVLATADQAIVEHLLDPSAYDFSGDAPTVAAAVKRAKENANVADAFAGEHGSGDDATVDYSRTMTLEGQLLLPAAQAELRAASNAQERVAADRFLSSADGKLNRFADAIAALTDARTASPDDPSLLLDIAKADYRLHDYASGIVAAKQYAQAMPGDSDAWYWLGVSYQRTKDFADAAPAYEKALALLRPQVAAAKMPRDRIDAIANVADTALDTANVYMALGDEAGTARAFAVANAYAAQLDPHGAYAELYRNVHERTQEGSIAAHLAHASGKTALSVAPWTGPDLPGSVASTLKFRLIVADAPNAKVDLRALGLHPGWVASFCADGLCSPNRVSLTLPDTGVKTYEFQLVPPGASRAAGRVMIRAGDGAAAAVPQRT